MFTSKRQHPIKSWKKFSKYVRAKGCNLLSDLYQYPDAILVAGCQRSGTTAVANMITTSDGMVNYWFGKDSELDAALLLSGNASYNAIGRFCFQTTYLNECVEDYLNNNSNYKLIWLVRNPYSVVYSMLHNWGRFAFNELFESCGSQLLLPPENKNYERFGQFVIPKIKRACLSYKAKTSQVFMLKEKLPSDNLMIVDYDDLVLNSQSKLSNLYHFIQLPFNKKYIDKFRATSVNKFQKLSSKERNYISDLCIETYDNAKSLAI